MCDSRRRITTETALGLLADARRRRILHRIAETADGTTLDRLANDLERTGDANRKPDAVRIELHHVHLPKLRDANVIEYDAARGTVRRGRHFRDVLSLLRAIENHQDTSVASS
ncbi:MAG: hypothetical protein ABEH47_02350 [Haloferacaceae archaeon]